MFFIKSLHNADQTPSSVAKYKKVFKERPWLLHAEESVLITQMDYLTLAVSRFDHLLNTLLSFSEADLFQECTPT